MVDPTALPGYPGVDILNLAGLTGTAVGAAAAGAGYRFRPAVNRNGTDPSIGGITALARSLDPNQTYGPVRWELLIQGTDYYLDRSGLWLALATKLDQNDYLAVSYVTEDGSTVGSFPGQDNPVPQTASASSSSPRPDQRPSTFRYEMRQIYRVAGSDLDRSRCRSICR